MPGDRRADATIHNDRRQGWRHRYIADRPDKASGPFDGEMTFADSAAPARYLQDLRQY